MATIAKSISDFSREGVNAPVNQTETMAMKFRSEVPKNFLTFYQNIISLISQYESAFEEENFNRMSSFVIAINNAIIKYFKSSNNALKDELNGIAEDTANAAKEYLEKKQAKSFDTEEAKDSVLKTIADYKEKILRKIQELTAKKKTQIGAQGGVAEQQKKPDDTPLKNAVSDTIASANQLLKEQDNNFKSEVQKFSISLGRLVLSNFTATFNKLNDENLKRMRKNIDSLNSAYSSAFYSVVNSSVKANNKHTVLGIMGVALKGSAIAIINTATTTLGELLRAGFALKSAYRIVRFWGGKIFSPIVHAFNIAKKVIVGAVNALWGVGQFVVGIAYNVVAFGVKTVFKTFNAIYSLSSLVFKKLLGVSIIGLFKKAFVGFIMSYPGAYFLGYLFGRIWGSILRIGGVSPEDIQNGNYSVSDLFLKPWLEAIKTKFIAINKTIDKYLTPDANSIAESVKEIVTSSKLWKDISDLYETVNNIASSSWEEIKDTFLSIASFVRDYVEPVASFVWDVVSLFVEGVVAEPLIAKRTYMGALHGLKQFRFFVKHVKTRGGLAAVIAGTFAAGAAAILGQTDKNAKDLQNEKEKEYFKLGISKRYAKYWGYTFQEGETIPEEQEGDKRRYMTISERTRPFLEKLLQKADESRNPADRRKYNEIQAIYIDLINEQLSLMDAKDELDGFVEFYDKHKDDGDTLSSLQGTSLANAILQHNGKSIFGFNVFEKTHGLSNQIRLLYTVLGERLTMVDSKLSNFEKQNSELFKAATSDANLEKVLAEARTFSMPELLSISSYSFDTPTENMESYGALRLSMRGVGQKSYSGDGEGEDAKISKVAQMFHLGFQIPQRNVSMTDLYTSNLASDEMAKFEEEKKQDIEKIKDLYVPKTYGTMGAFAKIPNVFEQFVKERFGDDEIPGDPRRTKIKDAEFLTAETLLKEKYITAFRDHLYKERYEEFYRQHGEKINASLFGSIGFANLLAQLSAIAYSFMTTFVLRLSDSKSEIFTNLNTSVDQLLNVLRTGINKQIEQLANDPESVLKRMSDTKYQGLASEEIMLQVGKGIFEDALKATGEIESFASEAFNELIKDFQDNSIQDEKNVRDFLRTRQTTDETTINSIRNLLEEYSKAKQKKQENDK